MMVFEAYRTSKLKKQDWINTNKILNIVLISISLTALLVIIDVICISYTLLKEKDSK